MGTQAVVRGRSGTIEDGVTKTAVAVSYVSMLLIATRELHAYSSSPPPLQWQLRSRGHFTELEPVC